MSQTRILAGKKAKLDGHIKENALSNLLTEKTGRTHSTDGGNKTKVDIFVMCWTDIIVRKVVLVKIHKCILHLQIYGVNILV